LAGLQTAGTGGGRYDLSSLQTAGTEPGRYHRRDAGVTPATPGTSATSATPAGLEGSQHTMGGSGPLAVSADVLEAVEIRAKYAGYLQREQRQIERHRHLEQRAIPEAFDYSGIAELRFEAREKFTRFRPRSLGQAARISGISPADITTLSLYIFRREREAS
jgi:hypothetical protein